MSRLAQSPARPPTARRRMVRQRGVRHLALFASVMVLISLGIAYRNQTTAIATASAPLVVRLADSLPGSIVHATPLTDLAPQITAVSARSVRVVYRSKNAQTGGLTNVSGSAFLPNGEAPPGGWPVVAIGHEGTGVDQDCAPSLSTTLLGEAPRVAALLKSGYAVTVADYQGLGVPGSAHQYLDVATAGRNVIDSVRALRGVFADISTRWAAFGTAQGGGAAWAADQQADGYAPELHLVGAVAVSPITDAGGLIDAAQQGTLTEAQRTTFLWSLASLERQDASLNPDDYRHGVAAEKWDALIACSGALVHEGTAAAKRLDRLDLAPSSPEAADALRTEMSKFGIRGEPLSAPLFVSYRADDTVMDPRWIANAIGFGCSAGGVIDTQFERGAGNRELAEANRIAWLTARFAGKPVANDCQSGSLSSPGAGSIVGTEEIPDVLAALPPGSQATRVLYGSTNGDTGDPTVVSGTVFTPAGPPPPGGWPVLALGHATTGIDEECAPSLSSTLLQQVPLVAAALGFGYAMSFTDYQGLGAPGVHPYLDSRTAGLNVIDSVRALRAISPDVSPRWAAIGFSQGGAAVWAADEQATTYAPELDLVGAVALAPPADVSGMVDKAIDGTLTTDQVAAFQVILASMSRTHPDFDIDAFRRGVAAADWDVLSTCNPSGLGDRSAALAALQMSDLVPATPQAAGDLRQLLQAWALPQRAAAAPLSVAWGTADLLIDAQWTTKAVARACELGDSMQIDLQQDRGHDNVDFVRQFQWLAERFRGAAVRNDCPAV